MRKRGHVCRAAALNLKTTLAAQVPERMNSEEKHRTTSYERLKDVEKATPEQSEKRLVCTCDGRFGPFVRQKDIKERLQKQYTTTV